MKGNILMVLATCILVNSHVIWALIGIAVMIIFFITYFALKRSAQENRNLEKLIKAIRS